jgi:hypothetical protein
MKAYRGNGGMAPLVIPAIYAGEWSASYSDYLTPEERAPVSTEYGAGWAQNCSGRFLKKIKQNL